MKITNKKQFEQLVILMEKNISIAKGFHIFTEGKDTWKNKWLEFSKVLNSFGPPIRNEEGWQKVCISIHKIVHINYTYFYFHTGLGGHEISN